MLVVATAPRLEHLARVVRSWSRAVSGGVVSESDLGRCKLQKAPFVSAARREGWNGAGDGRRRGRRAGSWLDEAPELEYG